MPGNEKGSLFCADSTKADKISYPETLLGGGRCHVLACTEKRLQGNVNPLEQL